MSFDSTTSSSSDPATEKAKGTQASQASQASADPATKKPDTETTPDHTSVFLVAGERAFRDADSVVKHVEHAQTHISTLEEERKADREQLAAQAQELARLRRIEEGVTGKPDAGNAAQTDQLSTEQLAAQAASMAVGLIAETKTQEVQKSNLATVEAQAKEAYGDGYATKVLAAAAKIGMSPQAVDALGATSPDAFRQLFLPAAAGKPPAPSQGSRYPGKDKEGGGTKAAVNIVRMSQRDRLATIAERMREAEVQGY